MELSDFLGAKNVIVQIVWGEDVVEFSSELLRRYEDGVLLKPYIYQDKVLELNITPQSGVVCNLFGDHPVNGKRVSWRNLELTTLDDVGEKLYYIKASGYNKVGNIDDRRTHPRIYLHMKGVVYDNDVDSSIEIMIHDLSDNGISFYAPAKYVPVSNYLTIHFEDVVNNQVFRIKVECRIKRRIKKVGTIFYGCEIGNANRDLQIYSFMKQLMSNKGRVDFGGNSDEPKADRDNTDTLIVERKQVEEPAKSTVKIDDNNE